MNYTILTGDNRITLKTLPDDSVDAIITDPPYGIDFLGKSWDANTGAVETYQECLRVLKPGGHILAFSAARTYHHLAVTLEAAGFEIRDQIMWLYSSGFPKSQDIGRQIDKKAGITQKSTAYDQEEPLTPTRFMKSVACKVCGTKSKNPKGVGYYCGHSQAIEDQTDAGKTWSGWGTQLKPAHEPIALARKPIKTSIRENCLRYGTGALNIDATRVETTERIQNHHNRNSGAPEFAGEEKNIVEVDLTISDKGRFPSNVLGEIPDYQKYFYCPKVSRKERHIGFNDTETLKQSLTSIGGYWCDEQGNKIESESADGKLAYVPGAGVILVHGVKHEVEKYRKDNNIIGSAIGNNHPTVKPIELMKYLIQLITPPGGIVLDPFNGSGSTGCAAVELGFEYIGCELDPAYVEIASKRIEAWYKATRDPAKDIFE